MILSRLRAAAFLSVFLFGSALAQPLPTHIATTQRLAHLRQQMKSDVDTKMIPGAVLLIARQGRVVTLDSFGFQNRLTQTPMLPSAIFRIASMTKPIVSVAAMMLAEEGKLDIGAPVAQYLPEFKALRVGPNREAPKRPMTVQDLLRHTSGLTYGIFGNSPVDELYRKSNVLASKSLSEMITTLAGLPLLHQPGEVWEYSVSTDVLGRVVEVASGMDLDRFIAARITGPLKMPDTGFFLTPAQATRLALPDSPMAMPPTNLTLRPTYLSGGGGMLSTASDYARFAQMLLNGGQLDGVRLLAPHTVTLMTSDQLPPTAERHTPVALALGAVGPTPEMGTSFGLGFGIRTDPGRNPVPGSVGDFSWSGITGTYFWVDPQEKLVTVLMVQLPQAAISTYFRRIRTLVYQTLIPVPQR